jgi:hypothetical protein
MPHSAKKHSVRSLCLRASVRANKRRAGAPRLNPDPGPPTSTEPIEDGHYKRHPTPTMPRSGPVFSRGSGEGE